jgi:serine/threonine-protein kinase
VNIGSYAVQRQIGEGAFGRTFLGVHRILGVPVCIKQEKTGLPAYAKLFRREAELLWPLTHVSLPTLKDFFVSDEHGMLAVMTYIDGEDLDTFVRKHGAIDDEHLVWIMLRVLDALSYLHYHGIVHCDVKPQNIILRQHEHNAVLVDFGIAAVRPDGKTRALGGTRDYVPPEFASGLPPLPASDLYSLGKTALFLAGGDPATGVVPRDMHDALRATVRAWTVQDPLARPQDAREVADELARERAKMFGRTTTRECLKLRNGEVLP